MKDKILITGTHGFVGKNLVKILKDKYQIFTLNEIDLQKDWNSILKNIFDQGIIGVFHVGACSDTLEQNVNYMMLLNYEVTKHITDLCKEYQVKLIYSSSAANYGVNNMYPSNLYGWSKYAGEGYVISNGGIALRYFNVYGPGEENKGKMASVAYQMFQTSQNNKPIKLFPGKPERDFVYINDVIDANIFALKHYNLYKGNWYEVGSGNARLFEDVVECLGLDYTYHPESVIPKGYQYYTCSDNNKWMGGWKPKYQLEDGIKDYLKYLVK